MDNRLLIIGTDEFYDFVMNLESNHRPSITFYKSVTKDLPIYLHHISVKNFVKTNLGLKDIGFVIEDAEINDVLIINYNINVNIDGTRALLLILREISIPIIFVGTKSLCLLQKMERKVNIIIIIDDKEFLEFFKLTPDETNIKSIADEYKMIFIITFNNSITVANDDEIFTRELNNINKDNLALSLGNLLTLESHPYEVIKNLLNEKVLI